MKDSRALPSELRSRCPGSGGSDAGAVLTQYYDRRHTGDYTATPLDQHAGRAMLLSLRIRSVLRTLQRKPKAVLDAGCGKGRWLPLWAELFAGSGLHGCDISNVAIEEAKRRMPSADLRTCTQDRLPFDSEAFDLVLSIEVLEHVVDPKAYLRELHRVLTPGGICVISTPCANRFSLDWFCARLRPGGRITTPYGERWYMEDPSHLRRITSGSLDEQLRSAGFRLLRFYFWLQFFSRLDTKFGIYFRSFGTRYSRLRRALSFLSPLFDALSAAEWALFNQLPNGAGMIGVFEKREATDGRGGL